MAQDVIVMAFRKRLKKRGYTGIRIEKLPTPPGEVGLYLVQALEPLAGFGVQVEMTLHAMISSMR